MVSIFTGNGLGVFQSSATQLGQGSGTRLGQGRESHGINVATGNLVLQALDEGLIVRGQSAAALRTYNSRGQVSGMGQDGWATGYERWVELDGELNAAGSAVRYHNGEGDQVVYAFDVSQGRYVATAGSGAHEFIMWDESGWYRYQDGNWSNQEYFESDEYRQSGEFDPQPRALLRWVSQSASSYQVNYDALGRVSEVVSSVGYPNGDAIVYAYEGNTQRLASIATRENGVVRTQVTYGYDPAGRLSWVQTDLTPDNANDNGWDADNAAANDGRLFRTRYAYTSSDAADLRIAGVTASDGATVSYTYEADGAGGWRVKTVTEGSAADGSARTLTFVYGTGSTDVVDAAGRTWTYRYDANKQLIAVLAPAVDGQRQATSYEYDAAGNVIRIATSSFATATGTGGASIEEQRFRYDRNGNRIQQRDLQGNVIAWTYNQANQVTSETRYTVADVDGLDADEAGNWSMPSGALTTRYVYEHDWSDRLRFVINAEGEVRELTYDSAAPHYDWMLASERRYLGDRYTGTTYTHQALSAWVSDAAAQRRANSSLTSYAYDAKGRLERSIEYATVTANAVGAGVLDTAATITRYVHDAQGLLRQSIVSRGAGRTAASVLGGSEVTEYVYDGMGRLLSVLKRDAATAAGDDAGTLQTIYSYVDSENRIRVAQDNGLVRIEARNRAGDLLSVSEAGVVAGASTTRTSANYYDNTGRLRASEDAAGGRSYFFHDTAGRLIATVDPTGAVSRTEYDAAGRVLKTTRHAALSNTQGWLAAGAVTKSELVFAATQPALLAADQAWVVQLDDDRVAQMSYDSAGRLVRAIDNAGSEVSYEYDGAGRLVRSTEWGDYIYGGGWGLSVSAKRAPAPSREARTTRMFYDNADRLVATLDAEGYLSESIYDAGGRLAKTVRYATRTNSAYWASGTLEQLRPVSATADQTTRLFHDARGRQVGQLDAEGYLTEMLHDEQNNQRATREYAKRLTGLSGTESLLALRTAAMTDAPAEAQRETLSSFNGLGQLIVARNHEGVVTRYRYDEAGRLVKTEAAADTSEMRAGGQRYDVFGHLIGELGGDGAALLHAGMTESELDALYAQYGVRHRYDALGRRIESVDALGHKTWYFHDEAGRQRFVVRGVEDVAGIKNALGEVSEVRYTAFGDVADTLAYDGRIAIAVPGDRASAASALQQLAALAGTSEHTQFAYDRAGRLIRRQEVDGAASDFEYNRFGEIRNAWRSSASGEWISSAAYTYDRRGQRIGTEEYDAYSWRDTSAVHDAFGRLVRATDARGTVSEFEYDRLGRQIGQVLRNVGGQDLSTQTSYDAFDRVVAQIDAMGRVTQYSHSDAARSMTMVTPEGVTITTAHNAFGQTIETRQPLPDGSIATHRMAYDNRGLLISATDALGNDTTHQYDARGQLIRTTDATGRSVAYAYDAVGRTLSRSEDPDGLNLTTRYVHDGQGRQLQTTDPSGRVSRMTYDRKGRLIELAQDPDGLNLRTVYTWDSEGNRLSVTSGAGTAAAQTTAYQYDGLGRRISETIDPAGLALRTEYVYDANDNVIARSGYGGSARYAYDAANRLRFSIDAMGGVGETTYDANGRVVARRAYARALDLSAYGTASPDDAGMAALIDEQGLRDDARDVTSHVVYDRDGRVRLTINGAGEVTESVYDSAGRRIASKAYAQRLTMTAVLRDSLSAGTATIASLLAATPQSENDSVVRYFYDANDRVAYSVDGNGGMTRVWYDKAGRVVATRAYAKPATVGTLATATIASLDTQVDLAAGYEGESRIHDGAGRLRFVLAADNILRETRYDAAGNVASDLRYSVPADSMATALGDMLLNGTASATDFGAFVAANEATAASSHSVYDAAGRLRLSITRTSATRAAVVEQQYDQAGRVVGAYAFTALLTVDATLSAALSQGAAAEAPLSPWLNANRGTAQVQRMVYDAAGRVAYSIDGAGAVTSTRYDAIGMVASVRRHAQAVTLDLNGTTLDADTVASALVETAQDRVDYSVHDAAGRVVFRVHADASVEEIRYDAIGRVSTTLAYGAKLDATLMGQVAAGTATAASFASHVSANESAARAEGLHYDQAGRLRHQVVRSGNGIGQVVETQYDGIGRETARIRYGVDIGYALSATEGAVASAVSAALSTDAAVRATQMRTVRYFYDAGDRQRFAVDATGAISEQRFDAIGRITETRVYGTLPAGAAAAAADTGALSAWVATQATGSYRAISMTYDRAGQVTSRTDALGQSEFFQYDAAGNITRHTDRAGAVWNYEYDRAGRRTAEISPAVVVRTATSHTVRSIVTRMEYDGVSNLLRRTENADTAQTRITRYEYDNRGNAVRIVLPDPATGLDPVSGSADTIEIAYDTLGQAVSEKDPLGNRRYRVYDNLGRVIYEIDQEQQVTSHAYNAFGEEVRSVRHANRLDTSAAAFGAAGWVPGQALTQSLMTAGLQSSAADRGVDSSYTILGQKHQVQQDAVSYVKSDGSVATGRPTLRTRFNAYGEAVKTSILLEGTPDQVDAVWADTYRYYDVLGRETVSVNAEGYVNSQSYTAYGEVQSKTEHARRLAPTTLSTLGTVLPPQLPAAGDAITGFDRRVDFAYDALGRVSTQTVKHWSQPSSAHAPNLIDVNTHFGYDAEGRTTSIVDGQGTTTTRYDALGRMISVQQPSRSVVSVQSDTQLSLSVNTNLTSAVLYEQRSPYTELEYDAFGNAVRVQRYANGKVGAAAALEDVDADQITETEYDRRGRVVTERDLSTGVVTSRTYDAGDRVVSTFSQLRGRNTMDLTAQVDSDIISTYTYDKTGRQLSSAVVRERYHSKMVTQNGVSTLVRDRVGTSTDASEIVRYNAFGEVVAKDDRISDAFAANTPWIGYVYDNAGRMLSTNAQGGAMRYSAYDLAGRAVRTTQASVTVNAQGVEQVIDAVTHIRYDKLGRAIRQELPSNSDDLNLRPVTVREYDRWDNVVRNVDARGYETLIRYNSQNKAVMEIRPEVKVVNANGTEVRIRPTLTWHYDDYGRMTESRDANGNVQRMVYDNIGRTVQVIDALGNVTRMAYDLFDRERYVQNPQGYITYKAYDRAGRAVSHGDFVTRSDDATRRQMIGAEYYALQNSGDRWEVNNAMGFSAHYDYDSRHLLLGSRSAAGVIKSYAHDLQGRKIRETNGDPQRWRYLLSLTDVNGTITGLGQGEWVYNDHGYTYDDYGVGGYTYVPEHYRGPAIRKDREGEYVFVDEQTWDYDVFGRLIDHNDLGGADYDYIYHAVTGQLIRTTRAISSNIHVELSDGYDGPDPNAPPPDSTDGNASLAGSLGLTVPLGAGERSQFYYASGLVKEIREGGNWTRYAYDESGNRTMEETYTRDGKGNIVHLRTVSTYDSQGRLSLVRQFDMANGYEFATVRYSYDAAGNRRRVSVGNAASNANVGTNAGWGITGYARHAFSVNYGPSVAGFAPETTFQMSLTLVDGSPLPSWLSFDPATGIVSGTPPAAQMLTLRLTARSIDDNSVVVRDIAVKILPSQPPQLTYIGDDSWQQTLSQGQANWTFSTASAFMDPEGLPLQYSAMLRVGTFMQPLQPLPAGMQIDATTGVISGVPAQGVYQIVVTATDTDNQSVSKTLMLAVDPWQITMFEGDTFDVFLPDAFESRNGQPPNGYTIVSVNNAAPPAWLQLQQYGPGDWYLVGTPTGFGSRSIKLRATYADGSIAEKTLTLDIRKALDDGDLDAALASNRDDGSAVSGTLAKSTSLDVVDTATTVQLLEVPIEDDGGGGNGGNGGNGGSYTPVTPGATYIHASSNYKSFWYDYDAMNRVTVANGKLANGAIVLGVANTYDKDISYALDYDSAGREIRRRFLESGVVKYENTQYNERGQRRIVFKPAALGAVAQVAEILDYDAAGRLISRMQPFETGQTYAGQAKRLENYTYDADGRQLTSVTWEGFNERYVSGTQWYGGTPMPLFSYRHALAARDSTQNHYDLARDGRLAWNKYNHISDFIGQDDGIDGYTFTYLYTYDAREAYLETRVNGYGTGNFQPGSTTSVYDGWGRRVMVQDGKDRLFAYDAGGSIIQRKDSNGNFPITRYAFVNGQQAMASAGGYIDAVSTLTAYRNSESGSGNVTVQGGDTLRTIAGRVYGNESLWYVLASANALDGSETLTAGATLKVPEVKVNKNDADTFKPFNPADVIGSTTPSLDYVPPPPKKSCSALSIILTIVVVIIVAVVTIYTAGAAAPAGASAVSAAAGTGAAAAGGAATAAAASAGTFATGLAVLGGSAGFTMGTVAAVAVGAAVGAAAGQLASMAFGLTDKFDWGAIGVSALVSVATMGVGSALSGGRAGAQAALAAQEAGKETVKATAANAFKFGAYWAKGAAQAVAGNLANYGANWAMNRIDPSRDRGNEKFSWANLAASAVSGAVTAELGNWLGGDSNAAKWLSKQPLTSNSYVREILTSTANGFIGSAVQHNVASLLGEEGRPDYGQMAIDAFGNALAEAAKKGITTLEKSAIERAAARRERARQIAWLQEEGLAGTGIRIVSEDGSLKAQLQVPFGSDKTKAVSSESVLDSLVTMSSGLDALISEGKLSEEHKSLALKTIAEHDALRVMYEYAARAENPDQFKVVMPASDPSSVPANAPIEMTLEQFRKFDLSGLPVVAVADDGSMILQEVLIRSLSTGGEKSQIQHVVNTIASGAEAVVDFYDNYPLLADIAISGVQAVLTGGPVKSILMNFVKSAAGAAVDSLRDGAQKIIEDATQRKLVEWGWDESASGIAAAVVGFGFSFVTGGVDDMIGSLRGIVSKVKASAKDLVHGKMARSAGVSGFIADADSGIRGPYRGGSHRDMTRPVGDGLDSHHMPDRGADPDVSAMDGPAIQMDPIDHHATSSNGRHGRAAANYRAETAQMIQDGRYRDAMAREIWDVRRAAARNSGDVRKYNEAISEMLKYARGSGQLPGKPR